MEKYSRNIECDFQGFDIQIGNPCVPIQTRCKEVDLVSKKSLVDVILSRNLQFKELKYEQINQVRISKK
jgi:hypothetical protein